MRTDIEACVGQAVLPGKIQIQRAYPHVVELGGLLLHFDIGDQRFIGGFRADLVIFGNAHDRGPVPDVLHDAGGCGALFCDQGAPSGDAVALHLQRRDFAPEHFGVAIEEIGQLIQIHAPQQRLDLPQREAALLIIIQHRDLQQRFFIIIAVSRFCIDEAGRQYAALIQIAQFGNGDAAQPADLADGIAAVFHGGPPYIVGCGCRGKTMKVCRRQNAGGKRKG